ncbi:MAG: hypothetical protein IPK81_17315 [Rhodospirillales bacterium]|nr:MAG: hypothetical protein IPK81_17315 [Rhodospirillales bacterium]
MSSTPQDSDNIGQLGRLALAIYMSLVVAAPSILAVGGLPDPLQYVYNFRLVLVVAVLLVIVSRAPTTELAIARSLAVAGALLMVFPTLFAFGGFIGMEPGDWLTGLGGPVFALQRNAILVYDLAIGISALALSLFVHRRQLAKRARAQTGATHIGASQTA